MPGLGLGGEGLINTIRALEELEELSRKEELDGALGDSPGLAAKVISEKIGDLIVTLKAKGENTLVSTAGLILLYIPLIPCYRPHHSPISALMTLGSDWGSSLATPSFTKETIRAVQLKAVAKVVMHTCHQKTCIVTLTCL